MADEQKRHVARKLWIRDLLAGTYIKEEEMKPNYVLLQDRSRVARLHLLGVVVAVSIDTITTMVLDDGTGRISVRAFEPSHSMNTIAIGDVVFVIGRPRQFGSEVYVLPEIIRPCQDLAWLEIRKHELRQQPVVALSPATTEQVEEPVNEAFGLAEQVLGAIRSLDTGQGADANAVVEQVGGRDVEKTIQFLIQNGDIFEIVPGRFKVLE